MVGLIDLLSAMVRNHFFKQLWLIALIYSVSLPVMAKPEQTVQKNVANSHYYKVSLNKALTQASVEMCFSGRAPEYLAVDYKKSTKNLVQYPSSNQGRVEIIGRYWKTRYLSDNACVNYTVDISEHLIASKYTKGAVISYQRDNTWLWLPEKLSKNETLLVEFEHANQYSLSVPWVGTENKKVYRVGHTPHDWGFTMVIGEFKQSFIHLDSSKLVEVNFLTSANKINDLTQWMKNIAQSLQGYFGIFPTEKLQVVLLENFRFYKSPVPWGEVNRGGGLGLRFVINSQRSMQDFYADWTASHEFSHLLMPKMHHKDSWLSEGLASYLQYFLMSQANQISEQAAWQGLYNGLKRGEKGTQRLGEVPLINTIKSRSRGDRTSRTMRIYWTGAAYFLIAEWQLRKHSQGKMSLKDVLLAFNHCCQEFNQPWEGSQFASKLDDIAKVNIFAPLYKRMINQEKFPNFEQAMNDFGVFIDNGQVKLSERNAKWRTSLSSPVDD